MSHILLYVDAALNLWMLYIKGIGGLSREERWSVEEWGITKS